MNIRIGELSGSDANALHETIRQFNAQSQKQTRQMVILTWVIAVLTAAMLLAVIAQIWMAAKAHP